MDKVTTTVNFVDLTRQYNNLRTELLAEFERVAASGSYVLGNDVVLFEQHAAKLCGTRYALGVANGTDAISLVLRAMHIGAGHEVITVTNSFIGTAGAIVAVGAKPRFVDIGDDLNIDPSCIESVINKHTKAIIPVHLTGRPAAMDDINQIANQHGLTVIEDAAQAIGAKYKNKPVGSLADAACFSLHPLKNLNIYGDGGFISTNNKDLYDVMSKLRNHGLRDRDYSDFWGVNSRLDNLQAAFANIKFAYLTLWTKRFREIAELYRNGIKDFVSTPKDSVDEYSVYHNFIIQTTCRDDLKQYLASKGIDTKIHYPILLHLQPAAATLGYKEGDFPNAERLVKNILSLPIYPELTNDEVCFVIQEIRNYFTSVTI